MMKALSKATALCAICLALAGTCLARTWTSSDGKRTFVGDFVSATEDKVTVRRSTGTITFEIGKLSEADVSFVKAQVERAAALAASAERKTAPIPAAISGKLKKLGGKRLVKAEDPEIVPEYYFLAYTASW